MPVLLFSFATWIDKQFWTDNLYYGFTPAAIPVYWAFFITSFPGLVFVLLLALIDVQFSSLTSLAGIPTALPAFTVLFLLVNMLIHWFFWQFIWNRKYMNQNDRERRHRYNPKIIWANLLGIAFLFSAMTKFLMIHNNQSLLISNFGLLTLGMGLLVFANINWRVNNPEEGLTE